MVRLELPTVNVLNKIDLLQHSHDGDNSSSSNIMELPFQLDFYTDLCDLSRLVDFVGGSSGMSGGIIDNNDDGTIDYADDEEYQTIRRRITQSAFHKKHRRLHEAVCELVDDFGLLSYVPLDIQNVQSVSRVVAKIDKCNGYIYTTMTHDNNNDMQDLFRCAVQADGNEWTFETLASVQERFMGNTVYPDTIPELDSTATNDE
jgi:hypothetical protein